jgi:hypothetical protein
MHPQYAEIARYGKVFIMDLQTIIFRYHFRADRCDLSRLLQGKSHIMDSLIGSSTNNLL